MLRKTYFISACIIFAASSLTAQVLQPEDPSYLPSSTVNVKKTPNYTAKNELINVIEQKGLYPYKGHDCDDLSMSFEEDNDGKKYGCNEFSSISLRVTQYGTQGKIIFTQLKPYDEELKQLQEFESSSKAEPDNIGSRKSRDVITKAVTNGKMVLVKDVITCAESKYKQYSLIYFRSVALIGTTIVNITGSFNSDDDLMAGKIHSEIMEKLNKGFH